jgi:hypothetical protein
MSRTKELHEGGTENTIKRRPRNPHNNRVKACTKAGPKIREDNASYNSHEGKAHRHEDNRLIQGTK